DGFLAPQDDSTFISHTYRKTGQFDVYLNQYDSIANTGKYCGAVYPDILNGEKKITVTVLPYDQVRLVADPIVVCVGDSIHIEVKLVSINNYDKFNWTFAKKTFNTQSHELAVAPSRR